MSLRGQKRRLQRVEEAGRARRAADQSGPSVVVIEVDENEVCRLSPLNEPLAFEPFEGTRAELHSYFDRHGWQPYRVVFLHP